MVWSKPFCYPNAKESEAHSGKNIVDHLLLFDHLVTTHGFANLLRFAKRIRVHLGLFGETMDTVIYLQICGTAPLLEILMMLWSTMGGHSVSGLKITRSVLIK